MAHYIGDVSQYGHTIPDEQHYSDYESWAAERTPSFNGAHFETYIERRAGEAVGLHGGQARGAGGGQG